MEHNVFTQKNLFKSLIHFAIPGVITIFMAELYNMVDTFFVGRYVGEDAIGAMGIAFTVQRLIIALSLMIGIGTATAVSRSLGEKNHKKLQTYIGTSITLGVGIIILVPIFMYLFPSAVLKMLGARENILILSEKYLKIVVLGALFLGFTNIFGYEMTALGHPRITLIATSIGTVINIIVDFILVGIVKMGVEGAAIATVISQMIAFIFTFGNMNYYKKINKFSLRPVFSGYFAKEIIAIGFATFIVEISDAILIASLNNILLPIGGNEAVIIVGAITRVSMLMYITIIGISSGMQPLVSYSYGAKDFERVKKTVIQTCKLVIASTLLLWAIAMIFANQIMGSFITEKEILKKVVDVFRFTITVFPLVTVYYVYIYYAQAVGKAEMGFFMSIYRQLLLFIPCMFILTNLFGIKGAWLTYPVTDIISAITGVYFLTKNMRDINVDNVSR